MVDPSKLKHVWKLEKSLYGLKQAPRAWNGRFSSFVERLGFIKSSSDNSLFVYSKGEDQAYLLLYVDDILLTASSPALRQLITTMLKKEFEMSDDGKLKYFLGIKIDYNADGMLLSQCAYAKDILTLASMQNCNPVSNPVDLKSELSQDSGDKVDDPTLYRVFLVHCNISH